MIKHTSFLIESLPPALPLPHEYNLPDQNNGSSFFKPIISYLRHFQSVIHSHGGRLDSSHGHVRRHAQETAPSKLKCDTQMVVQTIMVANVKSYSSTSQSIAVQLSCRQSGGCRECCSDIGH